MLQFAVMSILLVFYRKKIKAIFIDPLKTHFSELINIVFRSKCQIKKNKLLNADVDNDLLCIICMNKCRNIIF